MGLRLSMRTLIDSTRLYRYGVQVNSHDVLKVIAVVSMLVDHVGLYYLHDNLTCRVIGRLAAPLFFFLIGSSRSRRLDCRWLWYGGGLTILYHMAWQHVVVNLLINMFLCRQLLVVLPEKTLQPVYWVLLFAGLVLCDEVLSPWFEYGTQGLMFVISGWLVARADPRAMLWISMSVMYFALNHLAWMLSVQATQGQFVLLFTVMAVLVVLMINYHGRTWSVVTPWRLFILAGSRYSLEIYVGHLAMFMAFATLIELMR